MTEYTHEELQLLNLNPGDNISNIHTNLMGGGNHSVPSFVWVSAKKLKHKPKQVQPVA